MQKFNMIKMHSNIQVLKTGNKHRIILSKTINVKRFLAVSSVNETGKFKVLFVTHKPCMENVRNKTETAEDNKIDLQYCYHLFSLPIEKIKK